MDHWTAETCELILKHMIARGKEPSGLFAGKEKNRKQEGCAISASFWASKKSSSIGRRQGREG